MLGTHMYQEHRQLLTVDGPCRDPGFILATGTVTAADHEADEGYFEVGGVTVMAPAKGQAAMQLRLLKQRKGTLVFVPNQEER